MSLLRDPSVGSTYETPELCMQILGIDVILDDEVNMLSYFSGCLFNSNLCLFVPLCVRIWCESGCLKHLQVLTVNA